MAKNIVADWDTSASNNTDIMGVNIAEGCPAGGINDAIRALMAQIAAWLISASGPLTKAGGALTGALTNMGNGSTVLDGGGTARGIGYRSLPTSRSVTAAATLVTTDEGQAIKSTTGGLTVPPNATVALSVDGLFMFYNQSDSTQTITFSTGVTGRLDGSTTTGNRTVAARGRAFLWQVGTDEWSCSGNVT